MLTGSLLSSCFFAALGICCTVLPLHVQESILLRKSPGFATTRLMTRFSVASRSAPCYGNQTALRAVAVKPIEVSFVWSVFLRSKTHWRYALPSSERATIGIANTFCGHRRQLGEARRGSSILHKVHRSCGTITRTPLLTGTLISHRLQHHDCVRCDVCLRVHK